MIDLLSAVQVVLRESGFEARLESAGQSSVVSFEDDALMGFTFVFTDAAILLNEWRLAERSVLTRHSGRFRAAGDKAWNVYCVFLSDGLATPAQRRQVRWIEEDLEHTRKVAACGIRTRESLIQALLPILPLQQQPSLSPGDSTDRFRTRLDVITPNARDAVLDDKLPPQQVVSLLQGSL